VTSFEELNIADPIMKAIADMGFEEPSPIQAEAIPVLLEGKDLIGQAQTGTGKTAAFAIPVLQRLRPDLQRPQALIMAPTRELALQVAEEFAKIGRHVRVRELAVYGGSLLESEPVENHGDSFPRRRGTLRGGPGAARRRPGDPRGYCCPCAAFMKRR
jgi:ATP-dependent RNA helicase DeaD